MSAGAVQERSTQVGWTSVTVRSVGRPGTTMSVVALATPEALPVPMELMAETR